MAKDKKKKKPQDEMEVMGIVERELKLPLSKKDMEAKTQEAIECQRTQDAAAKEKQTLIENHKAALKPVDETISDSSKRIAHLLREMGEESHISLEKCQEVRNYTTKKVEFWFPNFAHGEKRDERDFSPEEHQVRMFKEEAESIPSTGNDPLEHEQAITQ